MLVHNRLNSLIAALRSVVGVFVAVSLFSIGLFVPVSAQPTAEVGLTTVLGNHFPAVESTLQHGASLVQGENTIPLDGVEDETVLVRFTTFGTDGLSLTSRGVPFLQSHSRVPVVSATTFLRAKEGKVVISASQPADVKIDVLAKFSVEENSVGSMRLLENPVAVVDTNERVGVDSLQGESDIYVNGHAAPEGTRFALVTINSEMQSAGILELGGQRLQLPVGKRATTTLALVTDEKITYSATGNGSLQIHVVGYIVSSAATSAESDGRSATTAGAIYGFTKRQAKTISLASGDEGVSVLAKQPGAAVFGFVAAKTDESVSGTVGGGFDLEGRATGIAVPEGAEGNPGEIVMLASEDPRLHSTVKATVEILPLAFIQSEGDESSPLEIRIETPKDDFVRVRHAIMEVSGHFTSSEAVEKIAISVDGRELSEEAFIRLEDEGGYWKHMIAPSQSGEVTIDVTMTTVSGRTATARWTGNVQLPDEDEIVLSPLTQILSKNEMAGMRSIGGVLFESENKPSYEIGKIIVGGSTELSPQGVLGQVQRIAHLDGKWYTVVYPVTLGNAILQGKALIVTGRKNDGSIASVNVQPDGTLLPADKPANQPVHLGFGAGRMTSPHGLFSMGDSRDDLNEVLDKKIPLIEESCGDLSFTRGNWIESEDWNSELSVLPATAEGEWVNLSVVGRMQFLSKCRYSANLKLDFQSHFVPSTYKSVAITMVKEALSGFTDAAGILVDLGFTLPSGEWDLAILFDGEMVLRNQLSVDGKATLSIADKKLPLRTQLKSPKLVFSVGPVPVNLSFSLTLQPLLELELAGNATARGNFKYGMEAGVKIAGNGGIEPIFNRGSDTELLVKSALQTTLSLGALIEPKVKLYEFLNVSVPISASFENSLGFTFSHAREENQWFNLLNTSDLQEIKNSPELSIDEELRMRAAVGIDFALAYELSEYNNKVTRILEKLGIPTEMEFLKLSIEMKELFDLLIFEYHYPELIKRVDFNSASWLVHAPKALGNNNMRRVEMNKGRYRPASSAWAGWGGRPQSCPQDLVEFGDYYSDNPDDAGLYSDFSLLPEGTIKHGITEPQYIDFDGDGRLDALVPVYADDICSNEGFIKWTAWRYDPDRKDAIQAISFPFGDHLPTQKVSETCSESIEAIEMRKTFNREELVFTKRSNIAPCDKPETSRQIKLTYSKDAGYFH